MSTSTLSPIVPLCLFAADSPRIEFELQFLNRIRLALLQSHQEMPSLPEELDKRISQLADQVYGLDELAYYLDDPDSDVETHHLREAAVKLLAKTIRFIESLPRT